MLGAPGVDHVTAAVLAVTEDKYLADLAGTIARQRRVRVHPRLEAVTLGREAATSRRCGRSHPPVGRGWEYLEGEGWDWDAELDRAARAPRRQAGGPLGGVRPLRPRHRPDQPVAHHPRVDRPRHRARPGARLRGRVRRHLVRHPRQAGHPRLRVAGPERDRRPHGPPRPGHGGDRRRGGGGPALRPRPRRHARRLPARPGHRRRDRTRRAPTAARSPTRRCTSRSSAWPTSRSPRRRRDRAPTSSSPGSTDGIYIEGDKSWSIDMQRYNFQFTGQRFFAIRDGQLAGQLRDVAYQATTTEFWGSMEAVGGEDDLPARRRLQLRQGPAGPGGAGQPRVPERARPPTSASSTPRRSRAGEPAERPRGRRARPRAAGGEPCVVIVDESAQAEVRFANNTTTTNGRRRDRRVVVVRVRRSRAASPPAWPARAATSTSPTWWRPPPQTPGARPPSPDASPLVDGGGRRRLRRGPRPRATSSVFGPILDGARRGVRAGPSPRTGCCRGSPSTSWTPSTSASSTGLRRRHVQPTGDAPDGGPQHRRRPARPGPQTRAADLSTLDVGDARRADWPLASVGRAVGRPCRPGATRWSSRPEAVGRPHDRTSPTRPAARTPRRAGRSSRPPAAGPGSASACATSPSISTATRPSRASSARPSSPSVRRRPRPRCSTTGSTLGRDGLGDATAASPTSATTGPAPPARERRFTPPGRQPRPRARRGRRARSRTWWPAPSGGSCSPACGTSGRSTRATLLLTGLTRDGVYLVEDGEVVGAVNNFRFNESPVDLLARILEAGASVRALGREFGEWVNRSRMPPLRVADFNMSTTSAAS